MSIRQSHGSARAELPRSAELPAQIPERISAGEPQPRDGAGRFAGPNPDAGAARWRGLVAEGLGRDLAGQAGQLGQRAHKLYRWYLRDLPCDSASVRSLVAQRARAVVLADAYALRAAEAGITTGEGIGAAQEAARWCARAERLAVTSLDISTRLARAARERPLDAHAEVLSAFGRKEGT